MSDVTSPFACQELFLTLNATMRSSGLKTGLATLLLATTSVAAKCNDHWVAIWGTMPQLVEPANLPNPPFVGFPKATATQ